MGETSEWRVCRSCCDHDDTDALVKYGTRDYAHPVCYFKRHGEAGIARLHAFLLIRAGFATHATAVARLTAMADAKQPRRSGIAGDGAMTSDEAAEATRRWNGNGG